MSGDAGKVMASYAHQRSPALLLENEDISNDSGDSPHLVQSLKPYRQIVTICITYHLGNTLPIAYYILSWGLCSRVTMIKLNIEAIESRCKLNYSLISPVFQIKHLPYARFYSLQKIQNLPTVAGKALPKDDDITPMSIPSPANDLSSPLGSDTVWDTCKTLTQLWAIVLPLGYAGIPLAAQAHLPGGPSFAAFGGEALALTAVLLFLRQKDFELQFEFNFESVAYGLAAGIAALVVNQILFSSGGGGSGDDGAATTTADVAAILLSNSNPAITLALFTASTLLAPATEEIIYRGFFLGSLTRLGVSPIIAVGAGAVAFSAAHFQPQAFLQLTFMGVFLGSAAVASKGNVLAPFIGHATYNSALFLSLLLSMGET